MIISKLKSLVNNYLIKKAEQIEYELSEEIHALENHLLKTKSEIVSDILDEKRTELANVRMRIDSLRHKN